MTFKESHVSQFKRWQADVQQMLFLTSKGIFSDGSDIEEILSDLIQKFDRIQREAQAYRDSLKDKRGISTDLGSEAVDKGGQVL